MKKLLAIILCACLLMGLPLAQARQEIPQISVLTPGEIPKTPKGMHHYLLICMDRWEVEMNNLSNSDGLVLVTIDEVAGRIITTSFIRDMLVLHPDGMPGRLTFILSEYGVQGLMDTLNRHFGIEIEKYILIGWNQVQSIVDAVGGVQLTVNNDEAHYLKYYPISPRSTKPAISRRGSYLFTGHAAVIYMRLRDPVALDGKPDDIGRTLRSRLVLSSIADSLKNVTYEKARTILDSVMQNIASTNLTTSDMLEAFNIVFSMRGIKLEQFRLPIDNTYKSLYYGGAARLMDFEANRQALKDFLFEKVYIVSD